MTRIAFVRHGQTPWNAAELMQGSSDIELNDTGRAQAKQAADWFAANMPDAGWDLVRHSPLVRASETAQIIADALSIKHRAVLPTLAEVDWGAGEGITFQQCTEKWPVLTTVEPFASRKLIPGSEPPDLVVQRGRFAISTLVAQYPDQQVIAVTHGTFLRLLMNDIFGGQIGFIPNTGIIVIDAHREADEMQISMAARSWS